MYHGQNSAVHNIPTTGKNHTQPVLRVCPGSMHNLPSKQELLQAVAQCVLRSRCSNFSTSACSCQLARYTIEGPKVVSFMLFVKQLLNIERVLIQSRRSPPFRKMFPCPLRSLPQVLMTCSQSQVAYQTLWPVCVEVIANPRIANAGQDLKWIPSPCCANNPSSQR